MAVETIDSTTKYAVVTGANKGIGFEICRQLASHGVMVVLTARNEKRGLEALEKLKGFGFAETVVFHQLDVMDSSSITSLAEFINSKYGRLDILVNNAGIGGVTADDADALRAAQESIRTGGSPIDWNALFIQTYDLGVECLQTNYYGVKKMIQIFIPLLQLSKSPRIVNVSSRVGQLRVLNHEWAKGVLREIESLTEEKIEEVINQHLKDLKEDPLQAKSWAFMMPAYALSKAAMNAYSRLMAKQYPSIQINCVCPGFVKTDIVYNLGILSPEEAAESPVRLALQPHGGPSGYAVVTGANKGIGFEICRQLASHGVIVVLTARNENRGLEALEKRKAFGFAETVFFHQLDVMDSSSITSLAEFIKSRFGRLDILVNNAGTGGVTTDAVRAAQEAILTGISHADWNAVFTQTYDLALECLQTNYYGVMKMIEIFIPLLQLSKSPRIVNVSSSVGRLKNLKHEWAKGVLRGIESLTKEKIEEVINQYVMELKEDRLQAKSWASMMPAYTLSKAAMNAYSRLMENKYPSIQINCVCPGFVKTDIIYYNLRILSPEEGAEGPVRLMALLGCSLIEKGFYLLNERTMDQMICAGNNLQ